MLVPLLLFLTGISLCFIIAYMLIRLVPKVNKITACISAIILTGFFTYEWVNNLTNNHFTAMP
ncbi:hypothetical protein PALU110988_20395 [Paenibacillus lupini]|nr:hypothetical protein [Paenibacillus lupini]